MPCAGCGGGVAREASDDGLFPVRYPNGAVQNFASAEAANNAVTQYGAEWIGPAMKGLATDEPKKATAKKAAPKQPPSPAVDDPAGSPSEEGS